MLVLVLVLPGLGAGKPSLLPLKAQQSQTPAAATWCAADGRCGGLACRQRVEKDEREEEEEDEGDEDEDDEVGTLGSD